MPYVYWTNLCKSCEKRLRIELGATGKRTGRPPKIDGVLALKLADDGLTQDQIATQLGCSVRGLGNAMKRARK